MTADEEKEFFVIDGWKFDLHDNHASIERENYTVLTETAIRGEQDVICPKCGQKGVLGMVRIETRSLKTMYVPAYGWSVKSNCECSGIVPCGIDGVVEQWDIDAIDLFLFLVVSPWRLLFKTVNYFLTIPARQPEALEFLRIIVAFFDTNGSPERFVSTGLIFDTVTDPQQALQYRLNLLQLLRTQGVKNLTLRLLNYVREFVAEECSKERKDELMVDIKVLMHAIPFTFERNPEVTEQDIQVLKEYFPALTEEEVLQME